jgi:hypothetical protein
MERLSLFTLFLLFFLIDASPIPNHQERKLVWASTPDSRGTLTIVFSCGAALLLCIWSGIHSNVNPSADDREEKHARWVAKVVGKTALAAIALFAPDIVLAVALHQFLVAWKYKQALNKVEPIETDTDPKQQKRSSTVVSSSSNGKQKTEVGMKMSFFATMGGFCFAETTPNGYRWSSLAFDTLLRTKTMEIIQKHPLSDIEDKSKASGIAKTVAVIQTGWILMQCLGRYLDGLHITLLELNTSVHVVLAIFMYGVWLRKPLDVDISIPAERHRLNHDFATASYTDDIRAALEKADSAIFKELNTATARSIDEQLQESPPAAPRVNTSSSASTQMSKGIARRNSNILVAMTIARSMEEAAEETSRIFYSSHAAVKSSLALETIEHDIKLGAVANFKNGWASVGYKLRHLKIRDAAYESAWDTANETAFKHTSQGVRNAILSAYRKMRDATVTDEQYHDILVEKLRPVLHKALEETRKMALAKAFQGADAAVTNVVGSSKDKRLFFADAVQSALAGCRAASRHAVQHQALNAVINGDNAADSVEVALHRFRNNRHPQPSNDIDDDCFESRVTEAKESVKKAFDDYIKIAGVELDKNIAVTADIVHRKAARGVLIATHNALMAAKNELSKLSPRQSLISLKPKGNTETEETPLFCFNKDELALTLKDLEVALEKVESCKVWRSIDPYKHQSLSARLKYPFKTAAAVLKNQLVDVPQLFTPRKLKGDGHHKDNIFDTHWVKQHRFVLLVFSGIGGAFYGAIHLTKWGSRWFPTPMEHFLWNIACCVGSLAVVPIGVSMILLFVPRESSIFRPFCIFLCWISWLLFGAARIYLIVESFMSMRSLPSSAYTTVQWSNAIPHI